MSIKIDMRQVVLLLAGAVDLVGVDDLLHGRRVAVLAVQCARQLGWDQETQNLLFDAGLLHDLGVSSSRVHRNLVQEVDWEDAVVHCERGSRLLKSSRQLAHLAPIILNHHTHWQQLQQQGSDGRSALYANLIFLVDRVDAHAASYYADNAFILHVPDICSRVYGYRGTLFEPGLVHAFLAAAQAEAFWFALDPHFMPQQVAEMAACSDERQICLEELKQLALILAEVVDAKSHFTCEHSLGVARLARLIAGHCGISGERLQFLEIAALMHDIGKLQIPDEVLESPAKLTPRQRAIMKKHSYATYHILKRVQGLEEVALWASQHHETLNGNGYPFHRRGSQLSREARIIKVADIYQAMAQDRPYRKPLSPAEILLELRQMQADQEVDPQLVDFVAQHLEQCHRAALGSPAAYTVASLEQAAQPQ